MFRDVKSLAKTPFQLKPFISKDGAGDITYGMPVDKLAAVSGKIQVVRDMQGTEHVSNLQLIVDGEVSPKDLVVFNGHEYLIKSVAPYYNEYGVCDITVVYL